MEIFLYIGLIILIAGFFPWFEIGMAIGNFFRIVFSWVKNKFGN